MPITSKSLVADSLSHSFLARLWSSTLACTLIVAMPIERGTSRVLEGGETNDIKPVEKRPSQDCSSLSPSFRAKALTKMGDQATFRPCVCLYRRFTYWAMCVCIKAARSVKCSTIVQLFSAVLGLFTVCTAALLYFLRRRLGFWHGQSHGLEHGPAQARR
jgi:hypothetical protein